MANQSSKPILNWPALVDGHTLLRLYLPSWKILIRDSVAIQRAETYWSEVSFTGAALLFVGGTECRSVAKESIHVQWPPLVLSVLGRTRNGLFLPRAPLDLEPEDIATDVVTTDPRLVCLARAVPHEVHPC